MKLTIYTSTTRDGSMKSLSIDDISIVKNNRENFLNENSISPNETTLVRMTYDRKDFLRYASLTQEMKGVGIVEDSRIVSDGLVVTQANHALFLPLADCIGAVIHDPVKDIMMVSHLGRHNLEQLGGTESINYLIKQHGVDPQNLLVWLSPAAGVKSYPLFAFNNRSLHDVAIEQLKNAGILTEHIESSSIDVAVDNNYFSHSEFLKGNRDTDGRFAIVAVMK